MLTIAPRQKIVEKIVTNKSGESALLIFLVTEFEGYIQAKLISMKRLSSTFSARKPECIAGSIQKNDFLSFTQTLPEEPSPYFQISSFFTSQLTRAPSDRF